MKELLFVVERARPDIYYSLKRACSDVDNLRVIWDRRRGGRRQVTAAVAADRRQGDRRSQKIDEELAALGFAAIKPAPPAAAPATLWLDAPEGPTPEDARSFLLRLPLFSEFSLDELGGLARGLTVRRLHAGEVLFREGDRGERMCIVYRGRVVISKAVVGQVEQVLTTMQPGDFFGEMSLFGGLRRSATANAQTDAVVLELDREHLQHLMARSERAGLTFFAAMVREFSRRLDRTDDLVAEVTRWGLEATGLSNTLEP